MKRLDVAIIGAGNMGQHHARIYSELPQANLVATCDANGNMGQALASEFSCSFYHDYMEMLSSNHIEAVSIAVPTELHHGVALEVLDAGVHVMLEKPIAANLTEARDIIRRAQEKGLKLMIGHIERFNPAVERLKELIDCDRLGKVISLNIRRVGGLPPKIGRANVLMDLGIHDIDMSNFLLGEYPSEVYGFKSKNLVNHQEDSAVILMKYKDASAFIEVNWVTPVKIRNLDVTGTKAFARLDYILQTLTLYENRYMDRVDATYTDFSEFVAKFSLTDEIKVGVKKAEPLRRELEAFIESIVQDKKPAVDSEEAYRALEIALSI